MNDWKVNTKLRKTVEARFLLSIMFWLTARSYGLIGNSIRVALETENIFPKVCDAGHGKNRITVTVAITLHWTPPRNDSPSSARSVMRVFILLRIWFHYKKAKKNCFNVKSNGVKTWGRTHWKGIENIGNGMQRYVRQSIKSVHYLPCSTNQKL